MWSAVCEYVADSRCESGACGARRVSAERICGSRRWRASLQPGLAGGVARAQQDGALRIAHENCLDALEPPEQLVEGGVGRHTRIGVKERAVMR